MSGAVQQVRNQAAINPRLLPAIDQLLIAGIKLGPRKKHEAINKILQLVASSATPLATKIWPTVYL